MVLRKPPKSSFASASHGERASLQNEFQFWVASEFEWRVCPANARAPSFVILMCFNTFPSAFSVRLNTDVSIGVWFTPERHALDDVGLKQSVHVRRSTLRGCDSGGREKAGNQDRRETAKQKSHERSSPARGVCSQCVKANHDLMS